MPIDHAAAENFIWSAARLVDRHRYGLLFDGGPAEPVIDALRGYRNPDGGFGHALEPDLRGPASQPAPTLYALEILNEAGAAARRAGTRARAPGSRGSPTRTAASRRCCPASRSYPHAPWFKPEPGSMLTLALVAVSSRRRRDRR